MTRKFLWGVASSGYQCEGGYNGPGQPHNNWAAAEETGRIMRTGKATDFWHRYEEDFALAKTMGLDAFRLSIEWARVQPGLSSHAGPPPDFDFEALHAYADRIAACRSYGMEPVVTLHHFTHPAWLGVDAWLDDATPALFQTFVETALAAVNQRLTEVHRQAPLHWYVTLNEPNMLVLNTYMNRHFPGGGRGGLRVGIAAYNRLLSAHVLAYNAIHDLYEAKNWAKPAVTMNTFCSDVYWSEKLLLDLLCVRERKIRRADVKAYLLASSLHLHRALRAAELPFKVDPFVWIGRLIHHLTNFFAPRSITEEAFGPFLDVLAQSPRDCVLDYLGMDYYDPFAGHLLRAPSFADLEFQSQSLPGRLMDSLSRKWWDWHMLPEGLHFFCRYYAEEYQRGILVAENGMALRRSPDNRFATTRKDRLTRSEFLTAHVAQVCRLLAEGVPMLGYLHWSLTDNYEWGSSTPRFGLFSIDYANKEARSATDHLGDNPSATYAQLIAEARQRENQRGNSEIWEP